MLIILHTPQFVHEDTVHGALKGRHTVSLSCNGGVITLDPDDCRAIALAVTRCAANDENDEDERMSAELTGILEQHFGTAWGEQQARLHRSLCSWATERFTPLLWETSRDD